MTKIAIALSGVADTGKTTTINRVYEQLKANYEVTNVKTFHRGRDIRIIIRVNGLIVGINSQGDPGTPLDQWLKIFVQADCDIIITATRSRGATVNAFKELAEQGYKLIQLISERKDSEDNHERRNNVHVDRILKHVAGRVAVAELV